MPTTTTKKVTLTQNTDGTFSATVETDAIQSVQIPVASMISFIQSQDVAPAPTPSPAPAPAAMP